jgi:hypothetical protein
VTAPWCALVGLALGCVPGPATVQGTVESEAVAPPGVRCLRFAIDLDETFANVVPGQRVTMRLDTGQIGRVSFVVQGFDVSCSAWSPTLPPTFASDPVDVEVRDGQTTRSSPPLRAVVRGERRDAAPHRPGPAPARRCLVPRALGSRRPA